MTLEYVVRIVRPISSGTTPISGIGMGEKVKGRPIATKPHPAMRNNIRRMFRNVKNRNLTDGYPHMK